MRKRISQLLSISIVISLLLISFTAASAAPLAGGPMISPSSGGGTATLTTIPVAKLPGTEANAAGTLFPIGHSNGDMMFSGSGVQVSGLVGSATLSMPLANYAQGWNGSIYQWLNETWVVIPTTVAQNTESNDATASATVYSNGIFALIVTYKEPEVTMVKCKDVESILPFLIDHEDENYQELIGGYFFQGTPLGTKVSYKIMNISPSGVIWGALSGTGEVVEYNLMPDLVTYYSIVEFPEGTIIHYNPALWDEASFTIRFYIGNCYTDFKYPFVFD